MSKQKIREWLYKNEASLFVSKDNVDFMADIIQKYTQEQSGWVSDHTVFVGSLWHHKNGNKYEVITIANSETKTDRYPVTVVYKNIDNGTIWSRPLSDWHRSMTPLPPTEEA